MRTESARRNLVNQALALVRAERNDETWADYDAHLGYCADAVDDAAADLIVALAVDKQQEEKQ
jgi:hypothetical protein